MRGLSVLSGRLLTAKSVKKNRKKRKGQDVLPERSAYLCASVVEWVVQLKESLASGIERLTAERVPSPRMNAELLLMFTLGCDRAYLYAHPERGLTPEESSRYDAALAERDAKIQELQSKVSSLVAHIAKLGKGAKMQKSRSSTRKR